MALSDQAASVIAKLRNKSKETGLSFQIHLRLFCQEEFLRRVSNSRYAERFILKGGLLVFALSNFESRPTIDIDFLLSSFTIQMEEIKKMIIEITNCSTGNDFISFEFLAHETIMAHQVNQGINFKLNAIIKNTKTPINIDIGVGDIVVPEVKKRDIPTQLEGYQSPLVYSYSIESIISEKYNAILQRMELTSRMKDFYDIYFLAQNFDFNSKDLKEAISRTNSNRLTYFNKNSLFEIVSFTQSSEFKLKWENFILRSNLPMIELIEVVETFEIFLSPIWSAIIEDKEIALNWSHQLLKWHL